MDNDKLHNLKIHRLKSPGPWIVSAIIVLIVVKIVYAFAKNPNINWRITGKYLFNSQILSGVWSTIRLSVFSMMLAIIIGLCVSLARTNKNRVLATIASVYITIFRSIPMLVQLIIWGNIGLLTKTISLSLPILNITFFQIRTNELISPFSAAVLGLGIAEGAYVAETIRSGLMSVDKGQKEAAFSLGISPSQTMRKIILPQALRIIVPPIGNQFIGLIKSTSLVSVIAGGDLLTQAQAIAANSYRVIELMAVASVWYFVIVIIASWLQKLIEIRLSRGAE